MAETKTYGEILGALAVAGTLKALSGVTTKPKAPKTDAERCAQTASDKAFKKDKHGNYVLPMIPIKTSAEINKDIEQCIDKAEQMYYAQFNAGVSLEMCKYNNSPSLKQKLNHRSKTESYSDDILDTTSPTIVHGSFVPEKNYGISSHRPEIIGVVNCMPIYSGDPKQQNLNAYGKMIEIQHQASLIRRDSLGYLLKGILEDSKDPFKTKKIIDRVKNNFVAELDKTSKAISFYAKAVDNTERLTNLFDIKQTSEEDKQKQQNLGLYGVRDFFKNGLGFREEQFDIFSGTKIYLQTVSDFRNVLQNYSLNLLDLVDSDRPGDTSPTNIDTTYTISDGFSFNIDILRSNTTSLNAAEHKFMKKFTNSLPTDLDKRIKLLSVLLSKEYIVSRNLGDTAITEKLRTDFDSDNQGNPFDNILGITGKTIFDPPAGDSSMASFSHRAIKLAGGSTSNRPQSLTVLPFERKYVDSPEQKKTYVPGKSFYVDSIFDLTTVQKNNTSVTTFNTEPMFQFVNEFQDRFLKTKDMILSLLDLLEDSKGSLVKTKRKKSLRKTKALQADEIYSRYLNGFFNATSNIDKPIEGQKYVVNKNSQQAFVVALMKLANTDYKLKSLLFQFAMLCGMISNVGNDENSIWADLALEYGTINAFPDIEVKFTFGPSPSTKSSTSTTNFTATDVSLLNGPKSIKLFVPIIIKEIDKRIRKLILNESSKDYGKIESYMIDGVQQFGTSTDFVSTYLRQIYEEVIFEKDSNMFREFVDIANKLTNDAKIIGIKTYLLDDNTGRTKYNFMSTSTQLLVMFEIMCSIVDRFGFTEFGKSGKGKGIEMKTNAGLLRFVRLNIEDINGSMFSGEVSSLGALTKKLEEKFGTADVEEFVKKKVGKAEQPQLVGVGNTDYGTNKERERSKKADSSSKTKLLKSLNSIKSKLAKERNITINFLYVLKIINDKLQQAKSLASTSYNDSTINKYLSEAGTIQNLRMVKSTSQIRVAAATLDKVFSNSISQVLPPKISEIFGSPNQNMVSISNIVPKEVKEAVYSYFAEPKFLESNLPSTRMKIFSVGIPSGFVQSLLDRVDFQSINQTSFKQKETDVISINLIKRDLMNGDIIFKPQKYIFDLSLFQRESEVVDIMKPEINESFSKLLERSVVKDFLDINTNIFYSLNGKNISGAATRNIKTEGKYSFLSALDKENLIKNHLESLLLEYFIKLSTGMGLEESSFLVEENTSPFSIDKEFELALISHIKNTLGKNIPENISVEQLIADSSIDKATKDLVRSVATTCPLISPNLVKDRVLKPKKYDRIFNVAVNIDEFEIDVNETNKTTSGSKALKQASLQNQIRIVKDGNQEKQYLKQRTENDIIFEDYMVVVESKL